MLSPPQIPARLNSTRYVTARSVMCIALSILALMTLAACGSAPAGQAAFERIELVGRAPANGQLLLADFGGDAATDILMMSRQPGRLMWLENPSWEQHQIPLVADVLYGVAAYSPPDSRTDAGAAPASLTLNGRFSLPGAGTSQQLVWLQNPQPASTQPLWTSSLIRADAKPGALLWADMTGTGRQILVTLPALEAYTLPQNMSRPWGMMPLVQDPLPPTRVRVYDWDLDGRDDLLVVSEAGVDIMALASRGLFVDEITLLSADWRSPQTRSQQPGVRASGFLDVGVGQSGHPATRFVATLSADTRQLMVFRPNVDENLPWIQEVIADSLTTATVLKVADLNRDTFDEIVVGDAGGLTVFYYVGDQQRWLRYSVDGTVAIADIQIHDLSGNGFLDIVTAPAETGPVLLFYNRGN